MGTYEAHPTAVIDDGCQIGEGTHIWHFSHIMSGCRIGKYCNIGQNVVISPGVEIGNQVKIQNNVSVYTGVICEDDVFLGPSCVFTNVINPRSAISRKHEYRSTRVKRGATMEPMPPLSADTRLVNTPLSEPVLSLPKMFHHTP